MRALQMVPAAVLFFTSLAAQAAVTLTYERKKAGGGAEGSGTATIVLEGEQMRMEGMTSGQRAGRSSAMIFDGAAKRMIVLDADKKSYREITEADAKQMKERMDGARAMMAERMKDVPPEHRKQAEEMMARMGGPGGPGGQVPDVKYEPTGAKKKVAGFACEVYKVQGGRWSSEGCFAPWTSNLVTKAEVAQFKKLMEHLQKTFSFVPAVRQGDWSKAPGIPIEQTHFGPDGKPDWTNTLKSVTRGSVPAAQFQIPAGYTKEEMPMGGRGFGPGGPGGRGPRGGGPGGPGGPGPGPGGPPK